MANKTGKAVDTTCLSLEQASKRGFIHRDYLAHCFRWSHVVKYLNAKKRYQTHHVLDIGCGKEVPLAKMMYSSRLTHTTGSYTGVDYGKIQHPDSIPEKAKKFKLKLFEKADIVDLALPRKTYDTITCFEVLEHVEPLHSFHMLKRIRELIGKKGTAFISTPCYDAKVGAADNHVNEMSYYALEMLIQLAGLKVDLVYGTFASQKDYKKLMNDAELNLFNQLSEYYDSNIVSNIFAPLFPEQSRNCLWQLSRDPKPKPVYTTALNEQKNLSSSTRWKKDLKKIMKEVG